jgi:hypothetical protein
VEVALDESGDVSTWSAEHYGYMTLDPPALHRRSVGLDKETRSIDIQDLIETSGRHAIKSALHLGPAVACRLQASVALLSWHSETGAHRGFAKIELDGNLSWSVHRGETNPLLGWYSSSFGSVEPTSVLLGEGHCRPGGNLLHTTIIFSPRAEKPFERKGKVVR